MKYLVAPEFTNKLVSLSSSDIMSLSKIMSFIKNKGKQEVLIGNNDIKVQRLENDIYIMKERDCTVYFTFSNNQDHENIIVLDIACERFSSNSKSRLFTPKDPLKNNSYNPNKNFAIDPRRNMTIDPKRNMTIDPKRNMTIDPRRNMMIDPKRNMMIDPKRNIQINPYKNAYYGGPYQYDLNLNQIGFTVRANEKVSLLFDLETNYNCFIVSTEQKNLNIFDVSNNWNGFLINAENDVMLRFDLNNNFIGFIV